MITAINEEAIDSVDWTTLVTLGSDTTVTLTMQRDGAETSLEGQFSFFGGHRRGRGGFPGGNVQGNHQPGNPGRNGQGDLRPSTPDSTLPEDNGQPPANLPSNGQPDGSGGTSV